MCASRPVRRGIFRWGWAYDGPGNRYAVNSLSGSVHAKLPTLGRSRRIPPSNPYWGGSDLVVAAVTEHQAARSRLVWGTLELAVKGCVRHGIQRRARLSRSIDLLLPRGDRQLRSIPCLRERQRPKGVDEFSRGYVDLAVRSTLVLLSGRRGCRPVVAAPDHNC